MASDKKNRFNSFRILLFIKSMLLFVNHSIANPRLIICRMRH